MFYYLAKQLQLASYFFFLKSMPFLFILLFIFSFNVHIVENNEPRTAEMTIELKFLSFLFKCCWMNFPFKNCHKGKWKWFNSELFLSPLSLLILNDHFSFTLTCSFSFEFTNSLCCTLMAMVNGYDIILKFSKGIGIGF